MRAVGSDDDLALSGWDGEDDPLVVFGEAPEDAAVRFAASGSGRLVAPTGDGLWRRAPWPVRDALFDWETPAGGEVLVAGERDGFGGVAAELEAAGATVARAARLTADALRAADVVVLLAGHDALPEHAMCVLAARRVLVTGPVDVAFGLQSGIEFLRAATADEAVERARMAVRHPEAVTSLRTMGRLAARRHAASAVTARLAVDLTLS